MSGPAGFQDLMTTISALKIKQTAIRRRIHHMSVGSLQSNQKVEQLADFERAPQLM